MIKEILRFKEMLSEEDRAKFEAFIAACAESSQMVSKWIPVTDRLPNENGNYLVTVMSWDESASVRYIDVDHYGPAWLHDKNGKKGRKVVAWISLPEPYEGSEAQK